MNSIEQQWKKLVQYFGIAPPKGCSEHELDDWARPNTPHPARRNRPELLRLLHHAKLGTLTSQAKTSIQVPGGEVTLENIPEFNTLVSLTAPSMNQHHHDHMLQWVGSFSPRNAELLQAMAMDDLADYIQSVNDFLERDQDLFERASVKLRLFESTQDQIQNVRMAVLDIETDDRNLRLQHLDDYTEYVLGPLAQSIQTYEHIRSSYLDHIKKQTLDVVMASTGMRITPIEFPPMDDIEHVLDNLPRLNEAEAFEKFKSNQSFKMVTDKLEAWVNDIHEQFETHVDVDYERMASDLKKGKVNIQINNCFGGTMKNVLYNPENEFSS